MCARHAASHGEVADQARATGARVLWGSCIDSGGGGLPFGPVVAMLRGLADDDWPATAFGPRRPALPSRGRLFEAVRGVVVRLAEQTPTVIVVDDLQWADDSTRDLLTFLLVNLGHEPVAMVLTYRSDDLPRGHPLRRYLAELDRRPGVGRLELRRSNREEMLDHLSDIAGAPPRTAVVDEVHVRSSAGVRPSPWIEVSLAAISGTLWAVDQPWDEGLDAVSVLVEPVRRSMYDFVRRRGRPVSREDVAEATGTSVKLAAFHLDKLVDHGWLAAQFDRTSRPKTGGRPPKLYRLGDRHVELSVPARRYDLMAEILLEASAEDPAATRRAAYDRGRSIAERFRAARRAGKVGRERTLAVVTEILAECGFEPRRTPSGEIMLANCPFQSLAETSPGMVCGANHALVEGVIAGLKGSGVEAVLDRAPDRCCVVLRADS